MGFEFKETEFEFRNNNIYTLNTIPEGNSNLFGYSSNLIYIANNFIGPKNNNINTGSNGVGINNSGNNENSNKLGSGNNNFKFFNNFVTGIKEFGKNKELRNGLIILINIKGIKFLL